MEIMIFSREFSRCWHLQGSRLGEACGPKLECLQLSNAPHDAAPRFFPTPEAPRICSVSIKGADGAKERVRVVLGHGAQGKASDSELRVSSFGCGIGKLSDRRLCRRSIQPSSDIHTEIRDAGFKL